MSSQKKHITKDRELELIKLAQAGDSKALGELVKAHKPFVQSLMRQITYPDWMDTEDVLQEGCIGLMEAVYTFNVDSGNRLLTHAFWKIKKALTTHMSKMGYMMSIPHQKLLDLRKHMNKLERTPDQVQQEDVRKYSTFKNNQLIALSVGMCSFEAPSSRSSSQGFDEDDALATSFVLNDPSLTTASTEDAFVASSTYKDVETILRQLNAFEGMCLCMYLGLLDEPRTTLKALAGQVAEVSSSGELSPGWNGYGVQIGASYNFVSRTVRETLRLVRARVAETMPDTLDDMGLLKHANH